MAAVADEHDHRNRNLFYRHCYLTIIHYIYFTSIWEESPKKMFGREKSLFQKNKKKTSKVLAIIFCVRDPKQKFRTLVTVKRVADSARLRICVRGVIQSHCQGPSCDVPLCIGKLSPKPVRSSKKPLVPYFALLLRRKCHPVVIKLTRLQHPRCRHLCLLAHSSFLLKSTNSFSSVNTDWSWNSLPRLVILLSLENVHILPGGTYREKLASRNTRQQ